MYNTHLEFHSFHSQSDDQTRLLQSGWLLFWTAVRDNGTVVCLSYPTVAPRTASASLSVAKFDTVGGPAMACMHGTRRSSRRRSTQLSAQSCPKTHRNRAAGREFDGISEANNINIRLCRRQKCRSVGKLLHFLSWNVSCLNSLKSNPMYNTHPKLYSKILGKKCVLYPRFYGICFVNAL